MRNRIPNRDAYKVCSSDNYWSTKMNHVNAIRECHSHFMQVKLNTTNKDDLTKFEEAVRLKIKKFKHDNN